MSQSNPSGQEDKAYTVVLHAKPATRIDRQVEMGFPDVSMRTQPVKITGLSQGVGKSSFPVGLEFRVQTYATSIEEAVEKGTKLADSVASFVTLVTGVGTPIVKPMLAYEITPGKAEREFLQFFDDIPTANIPRHLLATDSLTEPIGRLAKMTDAETAARVARAIRWYRFGTGTADVFDRFNAYWIGLEALNKPLQDNLGIGDDKVTCPNCSSSFVSTPTVSGIREFINRYFADEPKLYRRMRDLRIDIMHSKKNLDSLLSECSYIAPRAGNVLLGAIFLFMGYERPWKQHSETVTSATPFRMALPAILISPSIEDAFPEGGGDPHFEDTHTFVGWKDRPDGKIDVTVTSSWKAVTGKAQVRVSTLRIYGEGQGKLRVDRHEVIKGASDSAEPKSS
jgi:hypothetical protein